MTVLRTKENAIRSLSAHLWQKLLWDSFLLLLFWGGGAYTFESWITHFSSTACVRGLLTTIMEIDKFSRLFLPSSSRACSWISSNFTWHGYLHFWHELLKLRSTFQELWSRRFTYMYSKEFALYPGCTMCKLGRYNIKWLLATDKSNRNAVACLFTAFRSSLYMVFA